MQNKIRKNKLTAAQLKKLKAQQRKDFIAKIKAHKDQFKNPLVSVKL